MKKILSKLVRVTATVPKTEQRRLKVDAPHNWDGADLRLRRYESYEEYTRHQASKLATLDLSKYRSKFPTILYERIKDLPTPHRGAVALCLGAREGSECEAFIRAGFFSVGIDLEPGAKNKHVVTGDFHDIQFADATVDLIYTNTLDHVFDLGKVLAEVSRLLKKDGLFVGEIVRGSKDEGGREPGDYESAWWDFSDQLISEIQSKAPLSLWQKTPFIYPWVGDQCVFVRL